LRTTNVEGDIDNDGDIDQVFAFGARSFTIWSTSGNMIYDSGNDIAEITLDLAPNRFNTDGGDIDDRSDDRGAEPEAVSVLNLGDRYILFVGLERNGLTMVYDITNPAAPVFLQILFRDGDEAPEGVLAIPAADSPNDRDLLIISNEDSGTLTIYENIQ